MGEDRPAGPKRAGLRSSVVGLVVLFWIMVLGMGALGWWRMKVHRAVAAAAASAVAEKEAARTAGSAAVARGVRQTLVTTVALAPLPTALPLRGDEGRDADGYPLRYVDRPAFRSLLAHERFADLTKYVEQLQDAFEADPRKELWPMDAGLAFESAEPELQANLDAWVAASPTSFAPYFARGNYWTAVGWARRGLKVAKETHRDDTATMSAAFDSAAADLDKATAMRPKLVAAHRQRIRISNGGSDAPALARSIEKALATCPDCFYVRVSYIFSLMPRWGGSHAAMLAFAQAAPVAKNRRLRLLPGYVDYDDATQAPRFDSPGVRAAIDRACAVGDHWEFLLTRSRIRRATNEDVGALADVNRANELRPGHPEILFERASAENDLQHWEGSGRDLLDGLRIDPTSGTARDIHGAIVNNLAVQASRNHLAGDREAALRVIELAADLAPGNSKVSGVHRTVVLGKAPWTPEAVADLERRVAAAPDDFRLHQQLDYVLAARGEFSRIIPMWTTYLERHPEDGRAWVERGGTWFNLKDLPKALDDAQKGCDLGVSEGCGLVAKFKKP